MGHPGDHLVSKWPMDAEIHDRVTAALADAGLEDAVAAMHSPSERGTTRWALTLTESRDGLDVIAALARLRGVWGVRRYSPECITFDVDRTVPDVGHVR
jgi:hypothetical protein